MERDYDSLLRLADQESKEYQPRKLPAERRHKQPKAITTAPRKMSQPHNP